MRTYCSNNKVFTIFSILFALHKMCTKCAQIAQYQSKCAFTAPHTQILFKGLSAHQMLTKLCSKQTIAHYMLKKLTHIGQNVHLLLKCPLDQVLQKICSQLSTAHKMLTKYTQIVQYWLKMRTYCSKCANTVQRITYASNGTKNALKTINYP